MKKDLFNQIVALYTEQIEESNKKGHSHIVLESVKDKEDFIIYTFLTHQTDIYTSLRNAIINRQEKSSFQNIDIHRFGAYKRFLTIKYDKVKDKISIGEFELGYKWRKKGDRYYPYKNNLPLVCISKKIYTFMLMNLNYGKISAKPRLLTALLLCNMNTLVKNTLIKVLDIKALDTTPQTFNSSSSWLPVYINNYIGVNHNYEVLEKYFKIKIPKALRRFDTTELFNFLKVLKDPNELNTMCQWLSAIKKSEDSHPFGNSLSRFLALCMLKNEQCQNGMTTSEWLIRDYIQDLRRLNKKEFSIKISSEKRIRDAHRKASRIIMAKGMPQIKVDDSFIEAFKTFPVPNAELITDKKRLLKESVDMDHCVATYGHAINSGSCCIIHLEWLGVKYTLQLQKEHVTMNGVQGFSVAQCKTYANQKNGPQELIELIDNKYSYKIKLDDPKQVLKFV